MICGSQNHIIGHFYMYRRPMANLRCGRGSHPLVGSQLFHIALRETPPRLQLVESASQRRRLPQSKPQGWKYKLQYSAETLNQLQYDLYIPHIGEPFCGDIYWTWQKVSITLLFYYHPKSTNTWIICMRHETMSLYLSRNPCWNWTQWALQQEAFSYIKLYMHKRT